MTQAASGGIRLHQAVRDLLDRYLRSLDRAVPGLVDGLHLTGSVALGDYQHGVSDVDFLAITTRALGERDLAAVANIHQDLPQVPHLDGIYLDHPSLRTMPDNCPIVPHVVNGVFSSDQPCGELNPVLWLTLARYGIPARGPRTTDLGLHPDPLRLRAWNLENLRIYWQPLADQIRHAIAGREPDATANAEAVAWAALGPARLHYTLATDDVISKSAAGRYVAQRFPHWASLAERAINWRADRNTAFVTTDAFAAAEMITSIVDDAWHRWG
jgi:Nucleotidyltransferase domain